jgi:hypothetical protein
MSTFSRRSGIRREFSGPSEVSASLRERLEAVTQRYITFVEIGIGQEGLWVEGEDVNHGLAMALGRVVPVSEVLRKGEWHEVLDAVDIYLIVARDTAYNRYDEIVVEVQAAFTLSGSVYYVDDEGRIALRLESDAAAKVEQAEKVLTSSAKAKEVFTGAVSGLLSRRTQPPDVVKDVFVAFEEYLKHVTGQRDFAAAIRVLRGKGVLTTTQAQLMEKLYGFRSETFGSAHAGKARTPTVADAVWFVETVSAQLSFLANVVK